MLRRSLLGRLLLVVGSVVRLEFDVDTRDAGGGDRVVEPAGHLFHVASLPCVLRIGCNHFMGGKRHAEPKGV